MLSRRFPASPSLQLSARLVALGLLLVPVAGAAQQWDPFPPLDPDDHVTTTPALAANDWSDAERCLPAFRSRAGADYYAAIVDVTAAGGANARGPADAVPYAEALWRDWRGIDRQRDVLMVVSMSDRAVAVVAGDAWVDRGFRDEIVTATIDASPFAERARSGDLDGGLCGLAEEVDETLVSLGGRSSGDRSRSADDLGGTLGRDRIEPNADRAVRDRAGGPGADLGPGPQIGAPREVSRGRESGGVLGGLLGCVFLLGVPTLLGVWLLRSRRKKQQKAIADELAGWQAAMSTEASNLLDLEQRFPQTRASGAFADGTLPEVARLFALYGALAQRVEHAASLVASGERRRAREALALLREQPVRVDFGEGPVEVPAAEWSARLAAARTAAETVLVEREANEQLLIDAIERAAAAAESALDAAGRRLDLGVPLSDSEQERLDRLIDRRRRLDPSAGRDSEARLRPFLDTAAALEEVAARLGHSAAILEATAGEIADRRDALEDRVEALRAAGFRLDEPGFAPGLRLDRSHDEAEAIDKAIAEGRTEDAAQALERLRDELDRLAEQLDATAEARDTVPQRIEALGGDLGLLADRLPRGERVVERLSERYAEELFRSSASRLGAVAVLPERIRSALDSAREDHAAQRYLGALEDLDQAETWLADTAGALDTLEQLESTLDAARSEVHDALPHWLGEAARLRAAASAPWIGGDLSSLLLDVSARLERAVTEARAEYPIWPRLAGVFEALGPEIEDLDRRVAAESADGEAARQLEAPLRDRIAQLHREVEIETRDRPPIGRAVAELREREAVWAEHVTASAAGGGATGGQALLAEGRRLDESLRWARESFAREMETVSFAEGELSTAQGALSSALARHYSYGISANLQPARALVDEAERAARDRRWDDVLSLARRALEATDAAIQTAQSEERERERVERQRIRERQAAERRRRALQMAAIAAQAAASVANAQTRHRGVRPWRGSSTSGSPFGSLGGGGRRGGGGGGRRGGGSSWGGGGGRRGGGSSW